MWSSSENVTPPPVVLAVDDEPIVLRVVGNILRRSGYRVLTAASAEEACKIFSREGHIDLLFTDVVMPGVNGPELAQRLLLADPSLHILFTAGMPDSPLIRAGVHAKGFELLPKPFLPGVLTEKVEQILAAPVCAGSRLLTRPAA